MLHLERLFVPVRKMLNLCKPAEILSKHYALVGLSKISLTDAFCPQ